MDDDLEAIKLERPRRNIMKRGRFPSKSRGSGGIITSIIADDNNHLKHAPRALSWRAMLDGPTPLFADCLQEAGARNATRRWKGAPKQ